MLCLPLLVATWLVAISVMYWSSWPLICCAASIECITQHRSHWWCDSECTFIAQNAEINNWEESVPQLPYFAIRNHIACWLFLHNAFLVLPHKSEAERILNERTIETFKTGRDQIKSWQRNNVIRGIIWIKQNKEMHRVCIWNVSGLLFFLLLFHLHTA